MSTDDGTRGQLLVDRLSLPMQERDPTRLDVGVSVGKLYDA